MEAIKELTVCITGAGGRIAYSFIPMILGGHIFGKAIKINLSLLDTPKVAPNLKGLSYEIDDSVFPVLNDLKYGSDPKQMFKDCNVGVFFGGFPRQKGQTRKDLLTINGKIMKEQGLAINDFADMECKIVIVANPANTLAYLLKKFASKIPSKNITCLSRLDQNRMVAQLAQKAKALYSDVKNAVVWGNHSATQFPDISYGTIKGQSMKEAINDDNWLETAFLKRNQNRGTEVLNARNASATFSAAVATADHLRDWFLGKKDEYVSMGVFGNGEYPSIPQEICFSVPTLCKGKFEYEIVKDLEWSDYVKGKIAATLKELQDEAKDADLAVGE